MSTEYSRSQLEASAAAKDDFFRRKQSVCCLLPRSHFHGDRAKTCTPARKTNMASQQNGITARDPHPSLIATDLALTTGATRGYCTE